MLHYAAHASFARQTFELTGACPSTVEMAMDQQRSLPASVDRAEAEEWNRDLMEAFRQALEKDPRGRPSIRCRK